MIGSILIPIFDRGLSHAGGRRPDDPSLREASKHLILPDGIESSLWPRAHYRLGEFGESFDRWQQDLSRCALALDGDGLFAAGVGGVTGSIPRQVGKSFWLSRLLFALCVEIPGLRVIWTSHHGRTTTNTFRSVAGAAQSPRIKPFMRADRSGGVRSTNGEQELTFANGSVIMFGAREAGFGRGMDAIDVLVFDEAQILGLKALEDMVPATNAARNPHGGLIFFIGTPPRPVDDGEAFRSKRRAALSGRMRNGMYCEIAGSADLPVHSVDQYRIANPSHPRRVPLAAMQRMAENLPDEGSWSREALGIWDEEDEHERVMPSWDDWHGPGPASTERPVAFGVDRSVVHGISVCAAWHMSGDKYHVEEVWSGHQMDDAADFLSVAARPRDKIFVDERSAAAPMVVLLRQRKRLVCRTTTAEFVSACALIEEYVAAGKLTHSGQSELAAAVKQATRRDIRGGGWAWDRPANNSPAPIHKLIAASLAVLGASRKSRADPARRQRRSSQRGSS